MERGECVSGGREVVRSSFLCFLTLGPQGAVWGAVSIGRGSFRRDAPMLMVAWRLMTSGVSGVRVDASSEFASWIASPSSPTT